MYGTSWVGSPPSGRKKHLKDKKLYIIGRITTWRQKKALKGQEIDSLETVNKTMVVGQSDVHHGSDHHLAAEKSIKRIRN
jgi:hypothetical protein